MFLRRHRQGIAQGRAMKKVPLTRPSAGLGMLEILEGRFMPNNLFALRPEPWLESGDQPALVGEQPPVGKPAEVEAARGMATSQPMPVLEVALVDRAFASSAAANSDRLASPAPSPPPRDNADADPA
jgi:hypothetical protein